MPTDEEFEKMKADLEAANKKNEDLDKEIQGLKKTPKVDEGDDLREKARKEQEEKDAESAKTQKLEGAITFNGSLGDLIKEGKDILPESIAGIVTKADGEKYDNAIQKANAVRAAIVLEVFSIDENVKLLTASQKKALDQFKGLTKTDREFRAESAYENIFEPTFKLIQQVKKAEELKKGRAGHKPTDSEAAYKERLIKHGRKTLLGEKEAS